MKTRILVLLCILGSMSCDRPQMPLPPAEEYDHPAEQSFAWAMERMEHIIEEMPQSPRGLGLRLTYRLSHRLFPPKTSKDVFRGEVTIVSKATFVHRNPTTKDKEAAQAKKKQAAPAKDPRDFPADDPAGNFDDVPDLTAERPKQLLAEIPIGPQEIEEKSVFELEYRGGQWVLLDEPEEGVEKTWFDYAFQRDSSEGLDTDAGPESSAGPDSSDGEEEVVSPESQPEP